MIHPLEFFTEAGECPSGQQAPYECFARFWILSEEFREKVHRDKIAIGVKFEVIEGRKPVALGEVTKIVGLFDDLPT